MAGPAKRKRSARALAIEAARIAHGRHATDVCVLDLRGISPVTDYFVILTGTSNRQMRSLADEIAAAAATAGHRLFGAAGADSATWILLDFVDVVVHLFDETHRGYYDLELIWGDAPRVRWRPSPERAAGEEGGRKHGRRE